MKNLSLILLVIIISSCSTSSNVVRNGFFQKRKYKKGYNLSFKKKESKGKRKEETALLTSSSTHSEGVKDPIKKITSIQILKDEKSTELPPIYASVSNLKIIEYQTVFSKLVGDTIVDDYVNTASEEVGVGVQKIRIKRSKLYIALALVGLALFIVGIAVFPSLGTLGRFVFVPFLVSVIGFYASVFNLVKYTEAKFAVMSSPNLRDVKLLNRSKRLKNSSKLTLLFFVVSMLLLFAILLLSSLSADLVLLLTVLWFVIYVHFMIFLIMTLVNYLILYLSQRKEMKYDMSR